MPSERLASALQSGGLPFVLGYMHVNGPAGRAAQKATQVILLYRHGGEKQTSSNRRDRLYALGPLPLGLRQDWPTGLPLHAALPLPITSASLLRKDVLSSPAPVPG